MSDQTCSCEARMAGECLCGAWDDDSDEVAELRMQLAAVTAELERWRHDEQIEGDYVCPLELRCYDLEKQVVAMMSIVEAAKAWRAWSRADGVSLQIVEEKLIDAVDDVAIDAAEEP